MRRVWAVVNITAICLICAVPGFSQNPPSLQRQSANSWAIKSQQAQGVGIPIDQVRRNLDAVLSQREFRRLNKDPNLLQRAQAAVLEWFLQRLSNVAAYGGRNPWIAKLLEWGGIMVPAVLLSWWLMVRLRRQNAVAPTNGPAEPWAPSAREWQLWMQEADLFAQQQRWREAVHHTYWAAISRLEAHGLWPANRTRTPREYLALLRQDNALRPDLLRLTRAFERIWYGNSPAGEEQYREVRGWTDKLVPR